MNTKLMNMLVIPGLLVLTLGVSVAFAAPPLQDNPTPTPTVLLATTEPLTDTTGLTTTNEVVATATPAVPATTEPLTDSTTVTTTTDTTSNPSALPATGGVWPTSLVLLITLLAVGAALTVTGLIMSEFSQRNR